MFNKFEKFIFHACAYAIVISILFFGFAAISGMEEISISFGRYVLIVAFGFVISAAEILFSIQRIPKILCYVIHFASLFIAFLVVFIVINNGFKASYVFSALIIFTIVYFITLGIAFLLRKISSKQQIKKSQKRTDKKLNERTYTSKFS